MDLFSGFAHAADPLENVLSEFPWGMFPETLLRVLNPVVSIWQDFWDLEALFWQPVQQIAASIAPSNLATLSRRRNENIVGEPCQPIDCPSLQGRPNRGPLKGLNRES